MTAAIDATHGLQAYKNWRGSLKPLPIGTQLTFVVAHDGVTQDSSIKAGSHFVVENVIHRGGSGQAGDIAQAVYALVLVSKTGKKFKRRAHWNAEGIARRIELGEVVLTTV